MLSWGNVAAKGSSSAPLRKTVMSWRDELNTEGRGGFIAEEVARQDIQCGVYFLTTLPLLPVKVFKS
jgi:hypothetical protein